MARQASPFTLAIRQLLDESKGEITHKDARPLLKKMGHPVCAENDESAFKAERNYFDVTKYHWGKIKASGKPSPSRKPTSSRNTKAKVAKEVKRGRGRPVAVPKHPSLSTARNGSKKRTTSSVPSDFTADEVAALNLIESVGGAAAAQTKIGALRTEATNLEAALDVFARLSQRVAAVQDRINKAAA